jgi:putative membrane protein
MYQKKNHLHNAFTDTHNHVWYRWFNEAPVLMMVAVVILVVVKPF